MLRNLFLDENKGKMSVNQQKGVVFPLSVEERILPFGDISGVVNLKELYDSEKDKSDSYRMVFTINPMCSNILFNTFTEVVYKEGSNDCIMLNNDTTISKDRIPRNPTNSTPLNQKQAIRDTEYTHPNICEGVVYHCGSDIFNNHILRNNGFVAVSRLNTEGDDADVFNTIKDYCRDKNGNRIKMNFSNEVSYPTHLYNADNLLTFKEAFRTRLVEDDGWFGFTNASLIDIPNAEVNNEMVTVNKVMNNNKSCEFIDMFPDRSLYFFVPKVNKYKNRLELNWDYCLTYPYKKEYNAFQKLNKTEIFPNFNGIRIVRVFDALNENGTTSLFMESLINHNIKENEYVRLYYTITDKSGNKSLMRSRKWTKINIIGDHNGKNKNRFFSVSINDIDEELYDLLELQYDEDTDSYNIEVFFKKETEFGECDYYYRIFRKIPNFATSTKNIYDLENSVEDVVYECKKDYFNSEISKLSFSQNIYGDKISQILFTDTIDLTRLEDNNGKKVSEIYLTIVKRNQGYKSWYNDNVYDDNNSEKVEFSRAFGKVTSGLNLGTNELAFNYNVRRLHNVEDDIIDNNKILNIPNRAIPIEDDLTIQGKNEKGISGLFYGDIVELNVDTCLETTLEMVYHRFNTAQRETSNSIYSKINYDVMIQDDNVEGFDYEDNSIESNFTIEEMIYGCEKTVEDKDKIQNANIAPEGYFYQPHYKIIVNELKDEVTEEDGFLINFDKNTAILNFSKKTKRGELNVKSPKNYDFKYGDIFLLYEKNNFALNHYWGFLENVKNLIDIKIAFETMKESIINTINNGLNNGDYVLVKIKNNIPSYALPSEGFPYKFRWREVLPPSKVPFNSNMVNRPFTNGTHYIHSNINFYLRRQDPFGEYNLQYNISEDDNGTYNPLIDITPYGDYKDISSYEYFSSDEFKTCIN